MAVKSPLMPSPTTSAFSPFSDSPSSPAPFSSISRPQRSSADTTDSLAPPSPYPQFVDPSPVDSNGTASTDATDIDDVAQDHDQEQDAARDRQTAPSSTGPVSPASPQSELGRIDTTLAARTRSDSDTQPQSVIHAPENFKVLDASPDATMRPNHVSPSPTDQSEVTTVLSPRSPDQHTPVDKKEPSGPALDTNVSRIKHIEIDTPRAQTRQEAEEEWRKRSKRKKGLEGTTTQRASTDTPGLWSTWLPDIPEDHDRDRGTVPEQLSPPNDQTPEPAQRSVSKTRDQSARASTSGEQVAQASALKGALSECWTLCNTLANLSSAHRTRVFASRGQAPGVQEAAWRSCWRLCQDLYESRNEGHTDHVMRTLEMCREFCQALFDARRKDDETADSVLRVSFELNNHLYNTHDRNLPSAFQERTLDFYLTLCHRLMKQRTSLPEETDSLLRACWSLAEMLFSLRQNNREGKPADEELLSSAVQACWELCDLFREGWNQVRPDRDRGTPRPSQTTFSLSSLRSQSAFSNRSSPPITTRSTSSHSWQDPKSAPPETPTTIFDDTNDDTIYAPDENVPNILVLGPDQSSMSSSHNRWPSSSSTVSGYSEGSQRSTGTAATQIAVQTNMNRVRVLLLRAAAAAGWTPRGYSPPHRSSSSVTSSSSSSTSKSQNKALLAFVKALPKDAFGGQAWQLALVERYRKIVAAWPSLVKHVGRGNDLEDGRLVQREVRRMSGAEIARAVQWMLRSEQYSWMSDLFRVVFGCFPDDGVGLTGMFVQG